MPSIRSTAAAAFAVLCFIAIPVSSLNLREGPQFPDAAAAWAETNSAFLPSNYGAFSEYSLMYRKAIFNKLDSEIRSQLWTDHWEFYRINHPDLTAAQNKVLDLFTEYMNGPAEVRDKIDFDAIAKPVFDKEERRVLLGVLGPDDESRLEERENGTWNRRRAVAICSCSTSADYCTGSTCKAGGCTYQTSGCGHLWTYSCNGLCHGGSSSSEAPNSTQASSSYGVSQTSASASATRTA